MLASSQAGSPGSLMPQVTVYVRSEDLEKWKAVEKKSEFIHKALNFEQGIPTSRKYRELEMPHPNPKIKVWVPEKSCKHGSDPKFCKHAKPGKPCKS